MKLLERRIKKQRFFCVCFSICLSVSVSFCLSICPSVCVSPAQGPCVVFLGKTLYYHCASLYPGTCISMVQTNLILGFKPAVDFHPIQGKVENHLVASCFCKPLIPLSFPPFVLYLVCLVVPFFDYSLIQNCHCFL